MPTTYNGIGTRYCGKDNVEVRLGTCQHCGSETELTSYDARLCFCVVYIPLIPLRRKRIIDYCPRCTKHASLDVGEWERLRSEAIRDAKAAFEADPNDPEKAVALHATLASGGERDAANQLAEMLANRFGENLDVQIYLGSHHEDRGQTEQSNQRFHRAYELDPKNPMSQHVSAVALLREGDAAASRARLEELESSGETADPGLSFSIASKLHEQNDSQAAGEMLRKIGEAAPEVKRQKEFRKLATSVEEATGEKPGALARRETLWEKPALWWGLLATAVLAGIVAYDLHLMNNQRLFVVSGLPQAIKVSIDGGEPMTVHQARHSELTISQGSHTASVVTPAERSREIAFEVNSKRTSRWFGRPVHVVDPTQSAVVMWEETTYSKDPVERENPYELAVGQPSTSFDHADYFFVDFPNQIEVESRSEVVKARVTQVELEPTAVVFMMPQLLEDPATINFIESHLLSMKDREQMLSTYENAVARHDVLPRGVAFLGAQLDNKPVDVHLHRSFQSLARIVGDRTVTQRYERLLAASPDDPTLLYLRARIENYRPLSAPYYQRALRADPNHVMALFGDAFAEQVTGNYDAAWELTRKALAADPESSRALELRFELLVALERHAELEAALGKALDESPMDISANFQLMASAASRGDNDLARETHDRLVDLIGNEWPDDPYELQKRSASLLARLEGDFGRAAEVASSYEDPLQRTPARLRAFLLNNDAKSASELIGQVPDFNRPEAWLWATVVASANGDAAAREYRVQAADLYSKQAGTLGEIGRFLEGGVEADQPAASVLDLECDPHVKAALLLVMSEEESDQAGSLVELATKLSRLPGSHQPLLKSALAARGG